MEDLRRFAPDIKYPGITQSNHGLSVFLFGEIGTWKTTWCAGAPGVLFFSVGAEGGDDALANMPKLGLEVPPVFQISSVEMMIKKLNWVLMHHAQLGICTVVIDSLTFYVDMWINDLFTQKMKDKPLVTPEMAQRDWGRLENHICKQLAQTLHNSKLNIIWTALVKPEMSEPDAKGERYVKQYLPMMQGAAARKLPGLCKVIIFAEKEVKFDPATGTMGSTPIYHTTPPNSKVPIVRHKYMDSIPGGRIADPNCGNLPTFNFLHQCLPQHVYTGPQPAAVQQAVAVQQPPQQ